MASETRGGPGQLTYAKQPREFLRYHTDDHYNRECTMKINHGTTTLAFKYQGGIVVSVDSRASAGSWVRRIHGGRMGQG